VSDTDCAGSGVEVGLEQHGRELSGATLDLLVTGYLSAVAHVLDRRRIAEARLRIGPAQDPTLAGSLDLELIQFSERFSSIALRWDERSGCSALLRDPVREGIGVGSGTSRRYLHPETVPEPDAVAAFVADIAAGRDAGMVYPADAVHDSRRGNRRIRVLAALARHALPEAHRWLSSG
jgi:hypothetical protein